MTDADAQRKARQEIESVEAQVSALATRVALLTGFVAEWRKAGARVAERELTQARRELEAAKAHWRTLFEAWWKSR